MPDPIRDAIYHYLEKSFAELNKTLNLEQATELDGVLWDLSARLAKGQALPLQVDSKARWSVPEED